MLPSMYRAALAEALAHATGFLDGIAERPVARPGPHDELVARLGGPMPEVGQEAAAVVRDLAVAADPALIASGGGRYFGFVIGGALPAALAADWLTSAWDQNAGLHIASPAAALVESIVAEWLLDVLGLPPTASVGLVTGCQMANFTGLAAGRDEVLRRHGWDLAGQGMHGAPPITILAGAEAHATIHTAVRMLGMGRSQVQAIPADGQGRMRADAVAERLEAGAAGPTIICAQAGNVNTGAFDPIAEIVRAAQPHGAWVHVDGAFGLWAAVDPQRRALLLSGFETADSWATDGHKWLNVPYDSGIIIVRSPAAHRQAVANTAAAYLVPGTGRERDGQDWVPESSRRARAFPLYAALRSLGRQGLAALVDRCCALAARMADHLRRIPGARVLNDVVLNQVLLALPPREDAPSFTSRVIARIVADGTCWVGPTVWQGQHAIRVSVVSWRTTAEDIDRSAAAIARAIGAELA
jgi:glutamate/tyrosine decarboxylase-like PLP-dependent enzyme